MQVIGPKASSGNILVIQELSSTCTETDLGACIEVSPDGVAAAGKKKNGKNRDGRGFSVTIRMLPLPFWRAGGAE